MKDISSIFEMILVAVDLINILILLSIIFFKYTRERKISLCFIDILVYSLNFIIFLVYQFFYIAKIKRYEPVYRFKDMYNRLTDIIIITILVTGLYIVYDFIQLIQNNKNKLNVYSIKETIDNMKRGVCFSDKDGYLILTNTKMFKLVEMITDSRLVNLNLFWKGLRNGEFKQKLKKISESEDIYKLYDGLVWKFEREELNIDGQIYIQMVATDVTNLYRLTDELESSNKKLEEQQKRLRNLLANIAVVTQEEEILMSKIRVHDSVGRSVLATRRFIIEGKSISESESIVNIWENTISQLESSFNKTEEKNDNTKEQIIDIASMLGCEIVLDGELPQDEEMQYLMLSVLREAVTNSVRHVKANKVFVKLYEKDRNYCMTISDNSNKKIEIIEGGGLSNLRRKIESIGGSLNINGENGCKLEVFLKKEQKYV